MKKIYCIFFVLLSLKNFSTHIVGGEIIYDFLKNDTLGNEIYRVTIKIYRDCGGANAQFDGLGQNPAPAILTVRDINGALTGTYNIGLPLVTRMPPSINNPCIQAPNDVCVEQGIYTTTLTLAKKTGGYHLIYQRCCRNYSINNLLTPGDIGSTYYTKIPGPEDAAGNNSPRFINFPPIFLCANLNFNFNHVAFDADGDQLVYSFYTPFTGGDPCCPFLLSQPSSTVNCTTPSFICPSAAPPVPPPLVNYVAPYSSTYPVASNPALSIDPTSGLLSGRPNLIGQFVVGVCVKEYRNSKLINIHYRDFQFNIRNCQAAAVSNLADQPKICDGSTITFTNLSTSNPDAPTALWNFGVPGTSSDTSLIFNPTYTFPDTGKYTVTLITNPRKPCSDTIKKNFFIYPPLDISFAQPPKQCFNNNSFNYNATGQFAPGTAFNWDFSSAATPSASTQKDPTNIIYSSGGNFNVQLTAKYGICRDTFTRVAKVFGEDGNPPIHWDTTIIIGQMVTLRAFAGNGFTYTWTPITDYLNCSACNIRAPIATPPADITYTVLTEDSLSCYITKSTYRIRVELKSSVDVPTAFTPNSDGINDIIYVDGWGIKRLLYFKIFNRWGQLLFETNDIHTGWDGRYNGVGQNMETYVYQVSVETYIKEEPQLLKTGTFRLIR